MLHTHMHTIPFWLPPKVFKLSAGVAKFPFLYNDPLLFIVGQKYYPLNVGQTYFQDYFQQTSCKIKKNGSAFLQYMTLSGLDTSRPIKLFFSSELHMYTQSNLIKGKHVMSSASTYGHLALKWNAIKCRCVDESTFVVKFFLSSAAALGSFVLWLSLTTTRCTWKGFGETGTGSTQSGSSRGVKRGENTKPHERVRLRCLNLLQCDHAGLLPVGIVSHADSETPKLSIITFFVLCLPGG